MVTEEEVRAKLSLDTTPLARAKRDIAEFSEHGHSGFVHVGKPARAFHHLLKEIRSESPLMGMALTAALSPVTGAILAAGAALTFFNKKLDEWTEEMKEMGKVNAEAITNTREQQHKQEMERDRAAIKEKAWLAELHREHEKTLQNLELEFQHNAKVYDIERKRIELKKQYTIAGIGLAGSMGAMLPAAMQKAIADAERNAAIEQRSSETKRMLADLAATETSLGGVQSQRPSAERMAIGAQRMADRFKEQAEKASKGLDAEKKTREKGSEMAARGEEERHGFAYTAGRGIGRAIGLGHWFETKEKEKEDKERQAFNASMDRTTRMERAQKDLNKRQTESLEEAEKWKKKAEELKKTEEDLTKKRNEQKEALKDLAKTPLPVANSPTPQSPYSFSVSELSRYNTRYGHVAGEMERREAMARYATAAGRPDVARNILGSIYGEDVGPREEPGIAGPGQKPGSRPGTRIVPGFHRPGLMDLLPPGLTSEQQEIARQKALMNEILASLGVQKGKPGVPVNIIDVFDDSKK